MKAIFTHVTVAAILAGTLPNFAQAADNHASIDGTWRLASPQVSLVTAPGKTIPFTAAGRKQYEANKAAAKAGRFDFDLTASRCSSPGLPRIMLTGKRFHIFNRANTVTFMFEWNRLFRVIDLRPQKYDTELDSGQKAIGASTGTWQGDTLVVKSDDFTDTRLLDDLLPSSEDMTLEEKIRLLDSDTLQDQIKITDPKNFTRPLTVTLTYKRTDNTPFAEDVCLDHLAAAPSVIFR